MVEEVRSLSLLPQAEAKVGLLKLLGIPLNFNYDEKLRSEIISDFIYDGFRVSIERGFSHQEAIAAVNLTSQLMDAVKDLNLPGVVARYRELVEISGLSRMNRIVYTDYIFSTFMQHFKLYKFIMTSERDKARSLMHCTLNPPLPPPPLKEGKIPILHHYERQRKEIDAERQPVVPVQPIAVEKGDAQLMLTTTSQEEVLSKMIESVVKDVGGSFLENVKQAVNSTYHELDIKLKETLLPRPKQLGTPPRYAIPTVTSGTKLAAQSNKHAKVSARSVRH